VRFPRILLILLSLAALPVLASADTGTYRIQQYRVHLTPHSDGKVDIAYYQKWLVTGGHIPWVAVGLPNDNFEITTSGKAVKDIRSANEGGWSGVRIDLDRDYQPGQTFEISFSVSQNKLFYAEGDNYKLDFTPGWYDQAAIDSLEIAVKSFTKPETVTADPPPTATSEDELSWVRSGLREGERFSISISFPQAALSNAMPEDSLRGAGESASAPSSGESSGDVAVSIIVGLLILALVIFIIYQSLRGGYSGGGIFYGGGRGSGGGGGSGRSTGGGGGFGGSGFSCVCACACVGCACACACAGGGGAGCSRKVRHLCPACRERKTGRVGER